MRSENRSFRKNYLSSAIVDIIMRDCHRATDWLLESSDPSIRYLTLVDVLDEDDDSAEARKCKQHILEGPKVRALLTGQKPDGGFSADPYRKWTGSHWRLVSLVNLAVPPDNQNMHKAAGEVVKWIYGAGGRKFYRNERGYAKMHASVYGNALGTLSYLGLSSDPRVGHVLDMILGAQWPDGGWNCDSSPTARHSSFHESLATLWGLIMRDRANSDRDVRKAIDRTCELFLSHRIYRSHRTGNIIKSEWLKLRYPVYWHYNLLEAMRVIALAGKARDPRMTEALDLLESKQSPDGLWEVQGCYWQPHRRGRRASSTEAVDWGRSGPNEMITLNALRVLKSAGRAKL